MRQTSGPSISASSRRSCWCTAPSPRGPAGTASSSGCSSRVTPWLLRQIRCAAWPPIPPTPPACSARSTARCCWPGTPYGGAIITNAATSAPNVAGLVFVAAFAPDEGENLGDIESGSKDSILNTALVQYHYPGRTGWGDLGRVRDQPGAAAGGLRRRP